MLKDKKNTVGKKSNLTVSYLHHKRNGVGPLTFVALRGVVATAVLFGVLAAAGRSLRPVAFREALLLGLLQTAGFTGLVQLALVTGGAGKVAVLAYTMPLWTLLLARLFLGERLQPLQWLAVSCAAGGLVLILQPWSLAGSTASKLLAVGAGLCWAVAVIVAKRMQARRRLDLPSLNAWQLALGNIPIILLAWVVPEPAVVWAPELLGALAFVAIPGTALGWIMWLYVLERLPAGTASLNALAVPAIAVLGAWLQFGERPNPAEAVGMVVIAVGLALMSVVTLRPERQRAVRVIAQE